MIVTAVLSLALQAQIPESLRARVYVQAHLDRYGSGDSGLADRRWRLDAIRSLGAEGAGVVFDWSLIERVRGHPDFRRMDSVVAEVQQRGLYTYGLLTYSPVWAMPPAVRGQARSAAHRPVVDGSPAKGDTAFAAFAALTVRRYRGAIDRWEVWNEENSPDFWFHVTSGVNAGPSAPDYASLFRLAADSIHAADSAAAVAVGGLASFSGHSKLWPDPLDASRRLWAQDSQDFLEALLAAGLRPAAVAVHPYTVQPPRPGAGASSPFPALVIDSVEAVLDRAGLRNTPLWITEWGVHASWAPTQAAMTSWFRFALPTMLCSRRIAFVTLYTLTEEGLGGFGLVAADGGPSRAGRALEATLDRWACPGSGA